MGASESRSLAPDQPASPRWGYHVVRVAQGSPAQHAGFEPFFDFCVGLDGRPLCPPSELGPRRPGMPAGTQDAGIAPWMALENKEGQQVTIAVWNSKRQEIRDVHIVPSRAWSEGSAADSHSQPSLLGLTLRLCAPAEAVSHVWHILDVLEGSPADLGGLVPYGDYVIGWTGGPLRQESDFYDLVERHENRNLALYVYNSDYDHTREVIIMPNREWGEGLLGCGVGYGLLRMLDRLADLADTADRIPKPKRHWEKSISGGSASFVLPPSMSLPPAAQGLPSAPPQSSTPAVSYPVEQGESGVGVTVSMHEEEEE